MPTDPKTALHDLVSRIVCALVDRPDEVRITILEDEQRSTLQISSHPSDIGRLVGEKGRIADAIRLVINASALKLGYGRLNIEFTKSMAGVPQGLA